MAAILGIALVGTTATFGCSGYAKPLSWRPAIIENFAKPVPNRRSQARPEGGALKGLTAGVQSYRRSPRSTGAGSKRVWQTRLVQDAVRQRPVLDADRHL